MGTIDKYETVRKMVLDELSSAEYYPARELLDELDARGVDTAIVSFVLVDMLEHGEIDLDEQQKIRKTVMSDVVPLTEPQGVDVLDAVESGETTIDIDGEQYEYLDHVEFVGNHRWAYTNMYVFTHKATGKLFGLEYDVPATELQDVYVFTYSRPRLFPLRAVPTITYKKDY